MYQSLRSRLSHMVTRIKMVNSAIIITIRIYAEYGLYWTHWLSLWHLRIRSFISDIDLKSAYYFNMLILIQQNIRKEETNLYELTCAWYIGQNSFQTLQNNSLQNNPYLAVNVSSNSSSSNENIWLTITATRQPAHTSTISPVITTEGEVLRLECSSSEPLSYCWFTEPNGKVHQITEEINNNNNNDYYNSLIGKKKIEPFRWI